MNQGESTGETSIEVLDQDECELLLKSRNVGRLAVVAGGRPQIFPVNYEFQDGVVVFRSSAGFKLEQSPMTGVAFEVDSVDAASGVAWSVMVEGIAHRITDSIDSRAVRLRQLPVRPMAPGAHEEWIGIYVSAISGRRFQLPKT